MNNKPLTTLKTVLWTLVGVLAVVSIARFTRGLGAVSNLSDAMPWGYWNAFKLGAVAMSAGGFILAGAVYIFGLKKYHSFARPAVLLAFLGYLTFVIMLLFDLGLPWNIWHPMIYPQEHSVLFEVAICVMLYLTVLSLEFAPVILEHPWFARPLFRAIHKGLEKTLILLVIAGIILSTLHQSSLGSLFLITPYRLHPLWYSPIIWVLFFLSAAGLGLMVVAAESLLAWWLFGRKPRLDLLSGLGRAASVVLFLYAAVRVGDLAIRGELHYAFDGSWLGYLFIFEMCLGALVPAALLLVRRVRTSATGLALCAAMAILGIGGYRFDVCLVAFTRRMPYFPTWMEVAVSLGLVAGAILTFLFFVERLKVHETELEGKPAETPTAPVYNPAAISSLLFDSFRAPRRYSLAAIFGAALAVAMLPTSIFFGEQGQGAPVSAVRTLAGWMQPHGRQIGIAWPSTTMPADADALKLTVIRGSRDGWVVLFPHDSHVQKLGDNSCGTCHHQNLPFDTNTACSACHRDMYQATDIFNHALHVDQLGGNGGCIRCHQDASQPKNRDTAAACAICHANMAVADSFVKAPKGGTRGFAPSYMDAMHGLCISCHEKELAAHPEDKIPSFAQCANCHRDTDPAQFRQMPPYVVASPK